MINELAISSLSRVSSTLQAMYLLRLNRIHKFKPKVEIYSDVGPYILKTISTVSELKSALRLRYEVFHVEMMGKPAKTGIDVDEFDFVCDHLAIISKKTNELVGTYRMNCTEFSNEFYSAREFNIDRIMSHNGAKIELGRACIHKDFRNGFTISLLWRGIAEYMAATNSQLLFGCASVKTASPREAALLYRHFSEEGRMTPEYFAPPTAAYTMPELDLWIRYVKGPLTDAEKAEVKKLLPPLCRAYLKVGAYVGGEPAWDAEYHCIDFLTILHREDLNRILWKKFKLGSEAPTES